MVLVQELTLKEFPKKSFVHLEQQTKASGSYFQNVFINMDLEFYFLKNEKKRFYLLYKTLYKHILTSYFLSICSLHFCLYVKHLPQTYRLNICCYYCFRWFCEHWSVYPKEVGSCEYAFVSQA